MHPAAIGPFQIERELGRGGMGEVYLARDTRLDRPVADGTLIGTGSGFGGQVNTIGTGSRLQMLNDDAEANARIEDAFEQWSRAVDLAGKLRTMRRSDEVLHSHLPA